MIYFYLQSFLLSKIVLQIQTFYWLGQKLTNLWYISDHIWHTIYHSGSHVLR